MFNKVTAHKSRVDLVMLSYKQEKILSELILLKSFLKDLKKILLGKLEISESAVVKQRNL